MSAQAQVAGHRYRPEVDGLRALAVLAVTIYHVNEAWVPSGFLGVDIFFVISGYVITLSIVNRTTEGIGSFIAGFYVRRIKRLLPALLFCVGLTSAFLWFANPEPDVSFVTGALSLFGFSNIYLYFQATDYFAAPSQLNSFTHTWSLGVEEQFYFIYPVLFYVLAPKSLGQGKYSLAALIGTVFLLSAASLAAYIYFSYSSPMAAFFLMPMRFWEMGAGCILALLSLNASGNKRGGVFLNPLWPLILVVTTLFVPPLDALNKMIYPSTIVAVLSTVLLVALIGRQSFVKSFFSSRPVVYIGKISYSLYLWHWAVLTVVRWKIDLDIVSIPIVFLTMFLLAIVSYHFVEKPLRSADWSRFKLGTIGYGLGAAGAMAAALMAATVVNDIASEKTDEAVIASSSGAGDIQTVNARQEDPPLTGLTIVQYQLPCHLPKVDDPVSHCLTRRTDNRTIFVIGDSHASNLVPSFQEAIKDESWDVLYLGDRGTSRKEISIKADFLKEQLRSGDLVVFSMWRDRIYAGAGVDFEGRSRLGNENQSRINDTRAGLTYLRDAVLNAGAHLLLVDDVPSLCSATRFEVLRPKKELRTCAADRNESLQDRQPLTAMFQGVVGEEYYLDPHAELCPDDRCLMFNGDIPIFGDGRSHFSNFQPAPLTAFFQRWLAQHP